MKTNNNLLICLTIMASSLYSQKPDSLKPSKVDYDAFIGLTEEVNAYRKQRLLTFNDFLNHMNDEDAILLDTRSKEAYLKKHIKGAVHLNFSDFTDKKLAEVIPSKHTKILIYCNNNIDGDEINFARKKFSLALNIPTFINLYGYGYKNIYELASLIPLSFIELEFEGTSVQ